MMTDHLSSDGDLAGTPKDVRSKRGGSLVKWIAGIAAAVIGSLLVVVITNRIQPPPLGGRINRIDYIPTNSCCEFAVNFTLKGFKGKQAHWEAAVTDDDANMTSDPIDLGATSEPQANEDQATFELTVPINRPGDYSVAFILLDPKGTELDRKSSENVSV